MPRVFSTLGLLCLSLSSGCDRNPSAPPISAQYDVREPARNRGWGENGVIVHELTLDIMGDSWHALNNHGQVIGMPPRTEGQEGVLWSPGKGAIRIGTLGGRFSGPTGLNNKGEIVGWSADSDGRLLAFLYSGGVMRPFGIPDRLYHAYAINDNGVVVGGGDTESASSAYQSWIYRHGRLHEIEVFGDWSTGAAQGINDAGDVVGYSSVDPDNSAWHAYLYRGGRTIDLGTLGGATSQAYDINNSRLVVGRSTTFLPAEQHAFVYRNGKMHDLGTLGGTRASSVARSISNDGVILGHASNAEGVSAVIWQKNGRDYTITRLADIVNDGDVNSGWSFIAGITISDNARFILAYGSKGGADPVWTVLEERRRRGEGKEEEKDH